MKKGFGAAVEKFIDTHPIEITNNHLKNGRISYLSDEKLVLTQASGGSLILLIFGLLAVSLYIVLLIHQHNEIVTRVEKAKSECLGEISYRDDRGRLEEKPYYKRKVEFTDEAREFRYLGEERYRAMVAKSVREALFVQILGFLGTAGIGIFCLYYGWPKRKLFIFNRKEETLTYLGLLSLRQITLPFKEITFILGRLGAYTPNLYLGILHPNGLTRSIIDASAIRSFLSLYVWYMDRNRPLPPGNAFDPYREKDFLRRYSEGFPAPLYPSTIATPEFEFKGSLPTERSYFVSDEAYHRIMGKNQKKRNEETKNKAKKPKSEAQKRIDEYNAYRDGKSKE